MDPSIRQLVVAALALVAAGCAAPLAVSAPPLASFEAPVALFDEPDDEALRVQLDNGCFSGIEVEDVRDSLAALAGAPEGLEVTRVIENSPAVAAGLEPGDLLLEARLGGSWRGLGYPSDWRAVELESTPGERVLLLVDRAGVELEVELELVARLRPALREPSSRFSEDERVGVVLRTATEVEARAAGLAPGAGAVIVGLAASSPWRGADLRFGDLLVRVNGEPLAHPAQLIDGIRQAERGATLELERVRGGQTALVEAGLSRRERDLSEVSIPPFYRYHRDPDRREHSLLLGAVHYERTRAAWRVRLLWWIRFGRGDTDELEELTR